MKMDDVSFIFAVYEHFKFDSGLVVVNDIAAIEHQARHALLKSDGNKFNILEDSKVDQISESVSKEAEYGVCFVFLEDSQGFLKSIHEENQKVFKTTIWFIMLGKVLRAESINLGVEFVYDSNVNIVIEQSNKLEIKEIYSVEENFFQTSVGSWDKIGGLVWSKLGKWGRRRDLEGVTLRTVFLEETGYLVLEDGVDLDRRNLENVPWVGFIPDIFQSLATSLNFTFKLAKSRDEKWGAVDDSGEWNGIVKDLLEEEADISACSLIVTESRSTAIDFGLSFRSTFTTFFVSKQSSSYSIDIYTKPFTATTWLVLFIIIIGTSFIFNGITKFGKEKLYPEFSLHKCCIYVYGAFGGFAARRWSVTPANISAR